MTEFLEEIGRSRNWLDKKLDALGGRSRLEVWDERGLADRAESGQWLISPAARDAMDPKDLMELFPIKPTQPGWQNLVDDLITGGGGDE